MKRILSLIFAGVMVFTFTACRDDTDVRGDIISTPQSSSVAEDTDDTEFTLGVTEGSKYENKFIGIGCTFDSNWTFYDDGQIRELNSATVDMLDDDYAEQLKNADIIYDMYASHIDSMSSVNVNLQKVGKLTANALDLEEYLENSMPQAIGALEDIGYSDVKFELTTVNIDGSEFVAADITAGLDGYTLFEKVFCMKCDGYIANVTIASFEEETINSVIDSFYITE